jgi:hypothetical protein
MKVIQLRVAALVISLFATGCLDSIVDNPCEDSFALDENGECVMVEAQDLDIPPEHEEFPKEPVAPPEFRVVDVRLHALDKRDRR